MIKATLEVLIKDKVKYGHAHLHVELPFTPTVGLHIQQLAWKNPRQVQAVYWSIEEQRLDLFMGYDGPEGFETMYRGHGWEVEVG